MPKWQEKKKLQYLKFLGKANLEQYWERTLFKIKIWSMCILGNRTDFLFKLLLIFLTTNYIKLVTIKRQKTQQQPDLKSSLHSTLTKRQKKKHLGRCVKELRHGPYKSKCWKHGHQHIWHKIKIHSFIARKNYVQNPHATQTLIQQIKNLNIIRSMKYKSWNFKQLPQICMENVWDP